MSQPETNLSIYNTLTQQKALFRPIEPGQVKMYVCGMTVYDYCHLGHGRVMVAFDVITRYLRYRGYDVQYMRNITDIDDKILKRADENGEPFTALTARMIAAMHEDEAALSVLRPTAEPRATEHVDGMLQMIQVLIDKGYAYAASNGDVYYEVARFADYGKLSKRKLEDLISGVRIEVDETKKHAADFALWKAAKPGEASWPSPWGAGRPGWHIECSVMSTCCLGNTFDIHGGGPDLRFPHHENEIAQSEAATGQTYAHCWMHAGAVRVNKEKMSKSLGNFFTIREILASYPAEVVRYFLVASQYRSQIDYSPESLAEAHSALNRFYTALRGVVPQPDVDGGEWQSRFEAAMDDDFNTPEALAVLFDLVRDINRARKAGESADAERLAGILVRLGGVLGILQQDPDVFFQWAGKDELSPAAIEVQIQARIDARQRKDWAESDRIRDVLKDQGIILDDDRDGTTSWRRA